MKLCLFPCENVRRSTSSYVSENNLPSFKPCIKTHFLEEVQSFNTGSKDPSHLWLFANYVLSFSEMADFFF